MKRILPLVLVVGGVGLVLWFVVRSGQSRQPTQQAVTPAQVQPTQPAPAPSTATPPPLAEGERIVYQFEDEAKMREFAGLWQQRQKALLRLTVLRAYWDNEQSGAAALNTQLQTQYSLNPTSNYVLDGEKRVLIERPAPAAAATEVPPVEGQPADTPPNSETGEVVHTFTNEEEMRTFATLWQQRQGSGVRLAVLKSFWDEETASLNKLNETFTTTYNLDVSKNYKLDAQRRVLFESLAAAAPATPESLPAVDAAPVASPASP